MVYQANIENVSFGGKSFLSSESKTGFTFGFGKFARQTKSAFIPKYNGYKDCFNFTLNQHPSWSIRRYKIIYTLSASILKYKKIFFGKI